MLFRRSASLVDAVHLDGSEAAMRAVLAMPRASPAMREGKLELLTTGGRRIARRGDWITRDAATQAIRLYDEVGFLATHEAVR